jgi:class 3 adenylate cyclase
MKVLFNVPGPRISHAEDAVRAALAICEGLRSAPFSVGVGVETGMALVGHIGLSGVVDFTCVGEAVNHAARLQALAGPGEVLLGPNLWRKTSSLVEGRDLIVTAETLELKGIGSLEVHRLAARVTNPA